MATKSDQPSTHAATLEELEARVITLEGHVQTISVMLERAGIHEETHGPVDDNAGAAAAKAEEPTQDQSVY